MRYFLWKLPNPNLYWVSRGQIGPTECYLKDCNYWKSAKSVIYIGSNWIERHSVEITYQEAIRVILNPDQETVNLILREKQK